MQGLQIFHNSHSLEFRNPFGAVPVGSKVTIRLSTNQSCLVYINLINFYNKQVEIQMKEVKDDYLNSEWLYETIVDTSNSLGVIYYYFRVNLYGVDTIYGNNIESLGGEGQVHYNEPISYQITVYNDNKVPEWYKEGIIYQIFVDRFFNGDLNGQILNKKKNTFIYGNWSDTPMYIKDTNGNVARWDFYGGNLKGVTEKLNYIKSLGVNVIYFNPIFESPSCHKYDTSDYEKIDPMFGDEDDFIELCEEAKKIGIQIVLDGVFSHTGSDSKYFNKYGNYNSVGAYQSLNSPYYRWYRFNDYPKSYECWWGFNNMPDVDELNPSYLDYIIRDENSITKKWIKLGASGWRLDVADELPDEFIKLLKQNLKNTKKESVLIGEVWEDASNKISYGRRREYLYGQELDSITNYPLRQIIIDLVKSKINGRYFVKRYMSLMENYPKEYFYSTMNMLGNHDTPRILTELKGNKKLLKMAVLIQMTLPGVPLIYYGDEAGLKGGPDPDNRKSYPWGKEDMDILKFYKLISSLRANEDVLKRGEIEFINKNNRILCYERSLGNEKIVVIANPSEKEEVYQLKNYNGTFIDLIGQENYYIKDEYFNIILKSNECKILKLI